MSTGSRNYTGEDALQLIQDLGLKQQVGRSSVAALLPQESTLCLTLQHFIHVTDAAAALASISFPCLGLLRMGSSRKRCMPSIAA